MKIHTVSPFVSLSIACFAAVMLPLQVCAADAFPSIAPHTPFHISNGKPWDLLGDFEGEYSAEGDKLIVSLKKALIRRSDKQIEAATHYPLAYLKVFLGAVAPGPDANTKSWRRLAQSAPFSLKDKPEIENQVVLENITLEIPLRELDAEVPSRSWLAFEMAQEFTREGKTGIGTHYAHGTVHIDGSALRDPSLASSKTATAPAKADGNSAPPIKDKGVEGPSAQEKVISFRTKGSMGIGGEISGEYHWEDSTLKIQVHKAVLERSAANFAITKGNQHMDSFGPEIQYRRDGKLARIIPERMPLKQYPETDRGIIVEKQTFVISCASLSAQERIDLTLIFQVRDGSPKSIEQQLAACYFEGVSLGLSQTWTSSDGRTLQASFVKVDGNAVVLLVNGNQVTVPFAKLSAQSIAEARKSAAAVTLTTNTPTAPVPPQPQLSMPPELAVIDLQFKKLMAEKVVEPFDAAVTKLNSDYIAKLNIEIQSRKVNKVLTEDLESEKEQIEGHQSLSPIDSLPPWSALHKLRPAYQATLTTLEANRNKNLKAIPPIGTQLTNLEIELTKKNRIDDAKAVREYREAQALIVPVAATGQSRNPSKVKRFLEDIAFDRDTETLRWTIVPRLIVHSSDEALKAFVEQTFAIIREAAKLPDTPGSTELIVYIDTFGQLAQTPAVKEMQILSGGTHYWRYWGGYMGYTKFAVTLNSDKVAGDEAKRILIECLLRGFGLRGKSREFDDSVMSIQDTTIIQLSPLDRDVIGFFYTHVPPGTKKPELRKLFDGHWNQ